MPCPETSAKAEARSLEDDDDPRALRPPALVLLSEGLIALYETETEFGYRTLQDPAVAAELNLLWPLNRFPVLVDDGRTVIESSIIIHHSGGRVAGTYVPSNAALVSMVGGPTSKVVSAAAFWVPKISRPVIVTAGLMLSHPPTVRSHAPTTLQSTRQATL